MKNNIISVVLSAFSAILLVFSFAPFNLSFLAWIALVPLFLLLPDSQILTGGEKSSPRKIFVFYYLAGLIFWAYHIWWLVYVTFLGYCLLVIYLALFLGFFGLFLKLLRRKTGYPLVFIAPPLWVMFELARTYLFISFPWSLLGYSQWQNIPLIQISSFTGVYGVSFLIVMFNAAITDLSFQKTKKHFQNLLLSLLILTNIVVWGYISPPDKGCKCQDIKVSVVQGNIAQDIKWDEEYSEQIVNTYAELSIYAGTDHDVSLIVWPETSYPDYVDIDSALFKKIQNLTHYLGIPLLMGAVNQQNGRDYNSALLIAPDGEINQTYNKLYLVPFAEYLPLKKILFFLGDIFPQIGDFNKGEDYTIFEISDGVRYSVSSVRRTPTVVFGLVGESSDRNPKSPLISPEESERFPGLKSLKSQAISKGTKSEHGDKSEILNRFAVLICFEDLFPDLARRFTNKGANFLVVITNDAHFRESPALWQHFTHSVFRAVENRRPVVRAANNGISGFIDSYGRPVTILNENGKISGARGFATGKITSSNVKTFYTRFGDLFVYINIVYLFVLSVFCAWPLKQSKKNIKKL